MRVSEIIRSILDMIDQAEGEEIVNDIDPQPEGYEEKDVKRFKQIADVVDTEDAAYGNTPKERVAGVNAVTEELIRIAAVDNIVESMTSYPDAERIINKIIGDMK